MHVCKQRLMVTGFFLILVLKWYNGIQTLPSTIQVLVLCFKLYGSRDPSIHSMAGVAIRQIVSALFERVSKSTEEACGEGVELGAGQNMPSHTRDAYLLFQVCHVHINVLCPLCIVIWNPYKYGTINQLLLVLSSSLFFMICKSLHVHVDVCSSLMIIQQFGSQSRVTLFLYRISVS